MTLEKEYWGSGGGERNKARKKRGRRIMVILTEERSILEFKSISAD